MKEEIVVPVQVIIAFEIIEEGHRPERDITRKENIGMVNTKYS